MIWIRILKSNIASQTTKRKSERKKFTLQTHSPQVVVPGRIPYVPLMELTADSRIDMSSLSGLVFTTKGTIGTLLFIQIGSGLSKGGPAEMVTWIPISSPFVRFADRFVDPAFGFCAGVNYFALQAILIPFEVVAFNLVLQFWTDAIPTAAVVSCVLVSYALLNLFAVQFYGESEFWLSLGKVLLATGLIVFTFVTMVGGNPLHDAYGFRTWHPSKVPGTPFAEYLKTGSLGRFLGFLACFIQASFTMAGPDYVSMAAGEAQFPRRSMPRAFSSVYYRLTTFFILGALCVGVIVPYSDPDLLNALSNARPGAGSSPYVIGMEHLKIPVLPHVVNALILTAVYSCGNAFLQVSNNSAVVLQWFVNLVTASQLLNYTIISFTYIRFYKALKAQGISRESLPHKSFWQPFCGYYCLAGTLTMAFVGGYTVFLPGHWDVAAFFFSYTMMAVIPLLFLFWKAVYKSKVRTVSATIIVSLLMVRYSGEY
ncbi:amino acid permease-domain-containing protein [Collybia nuda]|uniref:Amino acid permease-domain-containing protein n=1 Tax=Collybia nuda TaxID=64659 RepID=A0A9P6CJY5_9AGAR|nr:amino acid permease-domain-containing protein [Collybia nuda]